MLNLFRSYGIGIALLFSWFTTPVEIQTISLPLIGGYFYASIKDKRPLIRQFLLLTLISLFLFPPILSMAIQNEDARAFDVLSSIKAASHFVMDEKNPYVENYFGTEVEEAATYNQAFWKSQGQEYLLFYHFPYLPGIFLLSFPFLIFFKGLSFAWIGFFLLIIAMGLILTAIRSPPLKEIALALFFLNPFIRHPFVFLHPVDLWMMVLMVGFTFLMLKGKNDWAGLALGVLLATKLYAWVLLPFIGYYWIRSKTVRPLGLAVLSFGMIILPFAINNFGAMLEDTVLFFISGGVDSLGIWFSRPGLLPLLVKFHILDSTMGWISIPLVGLSVLFLFYHFTRLKKISFETVLGFGAVALTAGLFFSKMANINYLGFVYYIFVCSILTKLHHSKEYEKSNTNSST